MSAPTRKPVPFLEAICKALPVFRPTDEQIVEVARPWVDPWWDGGAAKSFLVKVDGAEPWRVRPVGYRPEITLSMQWRLCPPMDPSATLAKPADEAICKIYWECVQDNLKGLDRLLPDEDKGESLKQLIALLKEVEAKGQEAGCTGLTNELLWLVASRGGTCPELECDSAEIKTLFEETKQLSSRLKTWLLNCRRLYPEGGPSSLLKRARRETVEEALKELQWEERQMKFHLNIIRSVRFGNRPAKGRPSWPVEEVTLRHLAALLLAAGYSATYDVPKLLAKLLQRLPGAFVYRAVTEEALKLQLVQKPLRQDRINAFPSPLI
jgi:hypothetical protein